MSKCFSVDKHYPTFPFEKGYCLSLFSRRRFLEVFYLPFYFIVIAFKTSDLKFIFTEKTWDDLATKHIRRQGQSRQLFFPAFACAP